MSFTEALKKVRGQFSYETEGATPKDRPTNILQWLTLESLDLPIPSRDIENTYAPGGGRSPVYSTGKRNWELTGSFDFKVQNGDFFAAILGQCVTVFNDPDYDHTITVADLPYFSIAYGVDAATDVILEFLGCKVNSATIKASKDEQDLLCSVEMMACIPSDGSALESLTPITTKPYVFKEGAFTATNIYASAKARINSFEITVNNNIEVEPAPSIYYPYDLVEGFQEYELKLNVTLEDDVEWDEIIDDTDKEYDYSMVFTRGTNDVLTISGTAKLKAQPWDIDQNAIKADLEFIPSSVTFLFNDLITAYNFD